MKNDQMKYVLPIPDRASRSTERLLASGDLFRYDRDGHSEVYELEENFAKTVGSTFALATSSCTSAMFLALKALDLPPKSQVVIPAFTFSAVPSAVVQAGHIPVLCEVTSEYRIDLGALQALLERETVACMLISHMRGHLADLDGLQALACKYGIPLIEDAAHALGTKWRDQYAGTVGEIGCFSFQSHKLINGGEGGMLVTHDPTVMARAVIMSGAYEENWRKHPVIDAPFQKWQNQLPTFNLRMSNLAAAIVDAQLDAIEYRGTRARDAYSIMHKGLERCRGIQLPRPFAVETRAPDSLQFNLPDITLQSCHYLLRSFKTAGFKAQVFGLGIGNARAYWNWSFLPLQFELPQTRRVLSRAFDLKLPIYSESSVLLGMASTLADLINSVGEIEAAVDGNEVM